MTNISMISKRKRKNIFSNDQRQKENNVMIFFEQTKKTKTLKILK